MATSARVAYGRIRSWRRRLRRLRHDRKGATAIEYGLIAAGIGITVLLAVFAAGDALNGVLWHAWSEFVTRSHP